MSAKEESVRSSVRYNVSDFLSDRLPYKVEAGFAAMRLRDEGKVFDAAAPFNILQWLQCLETCASNDSEGGSVNDEHVKAMQYLCAYSVSQEAKLCLLHHCTIQLFVALLGRLELLQTHCISITHEANQVLQLELLILECFHSFTAIAQGSVQLVQFAAAAATIRVLYRLYGVEECHIEHQKEQQQKKEKEEAIDKIKVAALKLLCSLSNNMIGRQCLLRGHDNEANSAKIHFAVKHANTADNMEYINSNVNVAEEYKVLKAIQNDMPSQFVHCVCCVLQNALHNEESFSIFGGVAMHAMELVSYLSIEKEGIEAILQNKEFVVVLEQCLMHFLELTSSLQSSVSEQTMKREYEPFAASMFSVIWNVAMDAQGVRTLEEHRFPDLLFVLLETIVCKNSANSLSSIKDNCAINASNESKENDSIAIACNLQKDVSFKVQRHLLGALCALHKLTSVKINSLKSCNESNTSTHNRLENFLQYLSELNTLVDENKTTPMAANNKNNNSYQITTTTITSNVHYLNTSSLFNFDDLVAICKNTVQCIRFASEVESVRLYMHNYLKWLQTTSPVNAFYLRRQLYFATKWQGEFDANV